MTATEKKLQEIKRKRARVEDIILAAVRKAVLSSMWLEVWTGDQVITPEGAANQVFNDWFKNEGGDFALERLTNMIIGTDLEKRRAEAREMIEEGLSLIIEKGIESRGDNASYEWCKSQWCGGDYITDILDTWKEDEDGNLAIDRLVNLIIH